jgi:hypothetical protein
MKRISILPFFTIALLATACLAPRCHAGARDNYKDDAVASPDAVSLVDPTEEAHKIRQLVKLALANDATDASRQVLEDETKFVEKNKKLRENVATSLIQDDNPDPTLPKIELLKYKDGSLRGLLFIQTDNVRAKPNSLAWVLDSKREHKEESR